VRRLALIILFLLVPASGLAHGDAGIDVLDVSGPLDASALEFMVGAIEDAASTGQELILLQINSAAALDEEALRALFEIVQSPPLPVAVWVGPAPAVAYGGVGQVVLGAEVAALSPGSRLGHLTPTIAGDETADLLLEAGQALEFDSVLADDLRLDLQPTFRQYLQQLNGVTFSTRGGPVTVETVEDLIQDGEAGVTLKQVTLIKPGLGIRFFRLAAIPEAAFLFLAVGLTIVSFEFFAIGPGVAAGAAALSLLLAGWGVASLPVRPWALAVAVLGWALLTASYQRGGVIALTAVGAAMLQVAGSYFVDGSGQIDPRWWLVLPSVLAVLFFFLLAMPTVQRARFSTQPLGREGLIGLKGVALVDFDPDGTVEVNGARWRATAHREAGITRDTPVVVSGVDGLFLEVGPDESDRET
jgi:membrane-bound serine protease (ClpP class)